MFNITVRAGAVGDGDESRYGSAPSKLCGSGSTTLEILILFFLLLAEQQRATSPLYLVTPVTSATFLLELF
jgi:hypothetical protein